MFELEFKQPFCFDMIGFGEFLHKGNVGVFRGDVVIFFSKPMFLFWP